MTLKRANDVTILANLGLLFVGQTNYSI